MSSPKKNKTSYTSPDRFSSGNKHSTPRNDVNSVSQGASNSNISQKDAELIWNTVIDSGIDPRSLAFEILTQRVANLLLEKKHKEPGSPRSKKQYVQCIVQETLQKDLTLRTVLNGIFKSSTGGSPLKTYNHTYTESNVVQHVPKYERVERINSPQKQSPSTRYSPKKENQDEDLKKIEESWKAANMGYSNPQSLSDEKALEKSQPASPAQKIVDEPELPQETNPTLTDEVSPSKSVARIFKEVEDPQIESLASPSKEAPKTPERPNKASSRMSDPGYNDAVSNFALSSPHTEKAEEKQEELKGENIQQIVDTEILFKEYELGKELLAKAADKLTDQLLQSLLFNEHLTEEDYQIIQIFMSLIFTVRENQDCHVSTRDDTHYYLRKYTDLQKLKRSFIPMIENRNFEGAKTVKFREAFVSAAYYEPTNPAVCTIKEYLWEAFWLIDIIEELKQSDVKLTTQFSFSDLETEEDLRVAPSAHPREYNQDASSSNITNDRTKESVEIKNSDLVDMEKSPYNSRENNGMTDIRSRYYKKAAQNSDYSYNKKTNSYGKPKAPSTVKNKMNRSKSKLLNSSTPKVSRASQRPLTRDKSTKKKLTTKPANVYGRSPVASTTSAKYTNKIVTRSPKKSKTPAQSSAVSRRKPATPVRPPTKVLEKRLESHLPSTMNSHQVTKRKSPRKSPKKAKRPELHAPKHIRSPVKPTQVEYIPSSPQRRGVTPTMSPKRKSPKRDNGRLSPTKRMIQMKNSYIKNQQKALKDPGNNGKMIYTISPDEAYIVDQEFHHTMENDDIAKKSSALCYSADKDRSQAYGDSMMKHYHKKRVYG